MFGGESFRHFASNPNTLIGFDGFGSKFGEDLHWLVDIKHSSAAHHVTQTINSVAVPVRILGTRIRN